MRPLRTSILRTLLYYDIFDHPLTNSEILTFLPTNSVSAGDVEVALNALVREGSVRVSDGFYFIRENGRALSCERIEKQARAARLWKIARVVTNLIKQFPFVRAVMVSGDLSKNVASEDSDIDFFIITKSRRLWICRTLLVLFKKIFLLNSKKYFCINYYISVDQLEVKERNIYIATEIAHLKSTYNEDLHHFFLEANCWIKEYFPNLEWTRNGSSLNGSHFRLLQSLLELPFRAKWADRIDERLMETMKKIWKIRYPKLTNEQRDRMFRCRASESRAHGGNFEEKILTAYAGRLEQWGLVEDPTS